VHRQNNNPYTHLTRKELHRKGKQNRLGQYIMSIYVYEDIVLIACIARAAYEEYNLIHILVMRWASHPDTTPATHPAPHPPTHHPSHPPTTPATTPTTHPQPTHVAPPTYL